jgi:thioredoxin 1
MEYVSSAQVAQLQSEGKKILIQYTASWCGEPCELLTPRLNNLSNQYSDVTFVNVDIEQNPNVVSELGIDIVPTVMIYNGQTLINRSLGANRDSVYSKILDNL